MASMGFGAVLNTQVLLGIMIALRTYRIPVFTSQQSFFPWQKKKRDPATGLYEKNWLLAPEHYARREPQCYFLPASPCALTQDKVDSAAVYGVTRQEQKFLSKT